MSGEEKRLQVGKGRRTPESLRDAVINVRIHYHEQVIEQEDFSLVDAAPLTSVWIGNLKQLTAAH